MILSILDVNIIRERVDLAEAMKAQMKSVVMQSIAEQGGGQMSPDMFKFEVWVYEVDGNVEDVLSNQKWPNGTQKMPMKKTPSISLLMMH